MSTFSRLLDCCTACCVCSSIISLSLRPRRCIISLRTAVSTSTRSSVSPATWSPRTRSESSIWPLTRSMTPITFRQCGLSALRSSAGFIASPLWLVLPAVATPALAAREGGLRRGDGDVFGRCAMGFCSGGDGDRLSSWIAGGVFRGLIGR